MRIFTILVFSFLCHSLSAVRNDTIYLDLNSTIHMIFDSPLLQADVGSGTYLDENGNEVSDFTVQMNGIRLKIAPLVSYFETTNLFVETQTGYFNFILVYEDGPKKYVHNFDITAAVSVKESGAEDLSGGTTGGMGSGRRTATSDPELYKLSYKIAESDGPIMTGEETQAIRLWIDGIFVNRTSDKMFISIKVENKGYIVYDWGYTGFFIRAKGNKSIKNEVVQEEEIKPVYIFNEAIDQVEGEKELSKVYVFDKFTIDKKKVLSIELWEDQGDRKIILELSSADLLAAERI